jgi:hypothetical protein
LIKTSLRSAMAQKQLSVLDWVYTLHREWKSKKIGFHLYYQRVRWTEGTQS